MKRFFDGDFVGIVDDDGKVLIPPVYHYIWIFKENFCIVNKFCFYGVLRLSDGKEIVPPKFDFVKIVGGYVMTKSGNKYGVYSLDGCILSDQKGYSTAVCVYSLDGCILSDPVFSSQKMQEFILSMFYKGRSGDTPI